MNFGLVVGDPALPGNDVNIRNALVNASHTVTYVDDDDAAPALGTYDAIVQGVTADQTKFSTVYSGYGDPVVLWRGQAAQDFNILSAASVENTTVLRLTFGEHAAAGAANGNHTVVGASVNLVTWLEADMASGMLPLGFAAATSEIVFGVIEKGAALLTGTAPARRAVPGFMNPNQGFTAAGEARIVAACVWAGTDPTLDGTVVVTEYTVGATGRNFAQLVGWTTASPSVDADSATGRIIDHNPDLVAQNIRLHLTPYDDAAFDEQWILVSADGWVTDSTRYLVIEPVGANRYLGTPGTGARLQPTFALAVQEDFLRMNVPYTRIGWFEIDGSSSAHSGDTGNDSSSGCKIAGDNMVAHDIYSHDIFISNRNRAVSTLNGTGIVLYNIETGLVRKGANPGADCTGIRIEATAGNTKEIYNFTIRGSEDMGLELTMGSGSSLTVRNGTITDNDGLDVTTAGLGIGSLDADYISTEDGTAPGANSDTLVDPADEFESATPDTANYYTLKSGAVGDGTGEDLGAGHVAATDITGTTRPIGEWDRAARQGTTATIEALTVVDAQFEAGGQLGKVYDLTTVDVQFEAQAFTISKIHQIPVADARYAALQFNYPQFSSGGGVGPLNNDIIILLIRGYI